MYQQNQMYRWFYYDKKQQGIIVGYLIVAFLYCLFTFFSCQWFLVVYKSYEEEPKIKSYILCDSGFCQGTFDKIGKIFKILYKK